MPSGSREPLPALRTALALHARRCATGVLALLAALVFLSAGARPACASVAVLLEMPYGQLGTFNPTGHAALYFDHICADSPLHVRPCRSDEQGVVISRYDGVGIYDWVAVPLVPYLYGVDSAEAVPQKVDKLSALRIRDLYRRRHLEAVAPDTAEGGMPQGNWYELAGSAFDRTLYGFQVKTTADQDAALIAYLNDRPNISRYQGAFRNCADFTRIVLNHVFPHAIHRNYIADFGLMTPKSVAHSLVSYSHRHPELALTTFQVPQLPGSIPRSMSIQGVTGSLLTRYGIPLAFVAPQVTAVVAVAYLGKGRFAMPRNAPVLDVAALPVDAASSPEPAVEEASRAGDALPEGAKDEEGGTVLVTRPAGAGFEPTTMFLKDSRCDLCGNALSLP